LAPQRFTKFNQSEKLIGIANSFSGGVFLAIAFVHIIPEAATNYYLHVLDNQSNRLIQQESKRTRIFELDHGVAVEKISVHEYTQKELVSQV
jgi:hypothetical protein